MSAPTTVPAHVEISTDELAQLSSAVIVGDAGGRVRVTGCVEESFTFTGIVTVETEVGTLYLDQDLPVTIVNPALPDDGIDDIAQAVGFLRAV
ncbi:hypothetical protein [Prescottella agglutinans]|uniref:Uncharacterized protein n=1 Tax=Prescottella agglutinans TaxID=1644129 RepID=A0ABT6MJV9_9NOCA|nr:hypothetical protein [Prescottella agglutinans]MDH6284606.1 hypothetical protein [Prescottella agglutinans]